MSGGLLHSIKYYFNGIHGFRSKPHFIKPSLFIENKDLKQFTKMIALSIFHDP